MVTNSHCTDTQGGNNNTIFYQPLALNDTYRIAIETRDPAYFTGGVCPSRKRCRYSDTAFARLPHPSGPGVTIARGVIAKPDALNGLTVTTGRFRVTGENSTPVLNETLNKVGRTTGWSQGKVVLTCVNASVSGTSIVQLCQDVVKARVAGGDSGSPVFRITNRPSANDVRLYGVLWGGGTLSPTGPCSCSARSARGTCSALRNGHADDMRARVQLLTTVIPRRRFELLRRIHVEHPSPCNGLVRRGCRDCPSQATPRFIQLLARLEHPHFENRLNNLVGGPAPHFGAIRRGRQSQMEGVPQASR